MPSFRYAKIKLKIEFFQHSVKLCKEASDPGETTQSPVSTGGLNWLGEKFSPRCRCFASTAQNFYIITNSHSFFRATQSINLT